jgi:hypothetical protein
MGISFVLVVFAILGGGGFPSKFFLLFVAFPTLVLLLLYLLLLRNTKFAKVRYITALFLLLSVFQIHAFGTLSDLNMEEAQEYMEVLIPEVEKFYQVNGYYPKDLNFIDDASLKVAHSKIKISEDVWKVEGYRYQYRLGMFFLVYEANIKPQEKPIIHIGRRDIRRTWDWDKRAWK